MTSISKTAGTAGPGHRTRTVTRRRATVVSSLAALTNGALGAATLMLSARHGQHNEIAAYTVATSITVAVCTLIGGGSTLLYMSGDRRARAAVLSQRLFVVLPTAATTATLGGLFYEGRGYSLAAYAAATLVAIGNNVAELRYSDLNRAHRFMTSAVIVCSSKLTAFLLVATGTPLTQALLAGAIAQLSASELCLRRAPRRTNLPGRIGISWAGALLAFRENRRLYFYNLAELFNARAASFAVSLFASPTTMGVFGTVVGIYQALGGVFYVGLQAPLAARFNRRRGASRPAAVSLDVECGAAAAAVLLACSVGVVAGPLVHGILEIPDERAVYWLILALAALPPLVMNRATSLNQIGRGDHAGATRISASIASALALFLVCGVWAFGPNGAAAANLLAEGTIACAVVCWRVMRARSVRKLAGRSRLTSLERIP